MTQSSPIQAWTSDQVDYVDQTFKLTERGKCLFIHSSVHIMFLTSEEELRQKPTAAGLRNQRVRRWLLYNEQGDSVLRHSLHIRSGRSLSTILFPFFGVQCLYHCQIHRPFRPRHSVLPAFPFIKRNASWYMTKLIQQKARRAAQVYPSRR